MVHNRHSIIFLLLLALTSLNGWAQTPEVVTQVDKNKILIGEQIELKVRVTMPDNQFKLTWTTIPNDFGAFVLASKDKIDSTYTTGLLAFEQRFFVTSFDSGAHVIPPLPFRFDALRGDSTFMMMTDSISVEVGYSPDDGVLPFHDIKPIIQVKMERAAWLWPGILAGILLLAVVLYFVLRRKKKKTDDPFASDLSDYDEAMKLIAEMRQEQLVQKGETKVYFLRMTDIFKRYISRRNNVNKMHLTGAELIADNSLNAIDGELRVGFTQSITLADAVKFAKYKPTAKESEECLINVENVIKKLNQLKEEAMQ